MKILTHMSSSDTSPILRDVFGMDDGEFYLREHPRHEYSNRPVQWRLIDQGPESSLERPNYLPIKNSLTYTLEEAYQQFVRPTLVPRAKTNESFLEKVYLSLRNLYS